MGAGSTNCQAVQANWGGSMIRPVFKSDSGLEEIRSVTHFSAALKWLYETGIQRGASTGWPALDYLYTARPREWTLITGIPSHGKSSFLDNVMVNMAVDQGWKWGVFSAENLPLERHASSLAAMYIGKPFAPGMRERISLSEYSHATQFIDSNFKFICPPEEDCTIDRVLTIAGAIHKQHGMDGLVIDPWNELDHSRPSSMNETEYISRALTKVRRFARDTEVHVFLVAHPTKLQRLRSSDGTSEATVYPIPTPYDVSGSAHFRNKADNCLCVWRDVAQPTTPTQIHVQKIRFREIGQVGMCELYYDPATGQYIDPARGARRFRPMTEKAFAAVFAGRSRQPGDDDE